MPFSWAWVTAQVFCACLLQVRISTHPTIRFQDIVDDFSSNVTTFCIAVVDTRDPSQLYVEQKAAFLQMHHYSLVKRCSLSADTTTVMTMVMQMNVAAKILGCAEEATPSQLTQANPQAKYQYTWYI